MVQSHDDSATQSPPVEDNLTEQLTRAKAEAESNLNGWKRAQADFENYKKRKEEENLELVLFAKEVTITKMLPSLDTLTQMMRYAPHPDTENLPDKYAQWLKGVEGTAKMIESTLAEMGVKKIEALGKTFNPHFHEAVKEKPPENGEEDGIVIEEIQTGYEINGKVIRPSQVTISRNT